MATNYLSIAITDYPLLTAFCTTTAIQMLSSKAYLITTTIPIEWGDIISLILAVALTTLYFLHSAQTIRQKLILACVTAWALRLGIFLAARIRNGFCDKRLDHLRSSVAGARKWAYAQTLWILLTLMPVWIGMTPYSGTQRPFNVLDWFAMAGFVVGLGVETVADAQKSGFLEVNGKLPPEERKPACDVGLFRYSRFPNYFGEWLLWVAVTLLGWQAGHGFRRMLVPICPWFVRKLFYSLSIPLAIKAVRERSTEEQFQAWSRISLFVPMPSRLIRQ